MALIKGNQIMLMVDNKAIAFASAHSLNITGETVDTSSKDNGEFGSQTVNKINWEITSSNFVTSYSAGVNGYDKMFDLMIAKQPIDVVFGTPGNYDANGLVRGGNNGDSAPTEWTPNNTSYLTGKAIITSLNLTANVGETATFESTLTGTSALSRVGSYIM